VVKPKAILAFGAPGGDYAMISNSTNSSAPQSEAETTVHLFDDWFDAIEVGLRERIHEFIQVMIESELETALARRATAAAHQRMPRRAMARKGSPATATVTARDR
jgi:hypothetical protein